MLRQFGTPKSIAALQDLMSDATSIDAGSGASHTRYYPVRAAAREALDHLKARIPAQRVEDALVEYAPLSAQWRVSATILLILIGVLWLFWRASPRESHFLITFGAAWLALMLATALLRTRSFHTGDELVFSSGSRVRVAAYDGLLQCAIIQHWPDHREALWGAFPVRQVRTLKEKFPWWTDEDWSPPTVAHFGPAIFSDATLSLFGAELEQQRTLARSIQKYGVSIASGQAGDPMGGMQPFFMVRLPIAYLLALMTIVPVAQAIMLVRRQLRRMQRRRHGQCVRCGYDLRASMGRCPECGAMAPVVHARTP